MADGAEYLIAIGATMTGGDAAIRQLGQLESKLIASGPAVDTLEKALKGAKDAFAKTGAASDEAASELALGERAYQRLQREARSATKALEKASAQGGVSPALQARADAATAALQREGAALDASKEKARRAAVAHAAMGSSVAKLEKATEAAGDNTESFGDKLKTMAGKALAAAKAVYSVGSTIATKFVVPAMQAHDELAMVRARLDALAGGAAAGGKVHAMIRDLGSEIGSTDEALAPLAVKLLALGMPVDGLREKVKAFAAQEALGLGGVDAMTQVLTKLGDKLKLTGTDMGWLKEDFTQLAKTTGVTGEAIAKEMGYSVEQLDEQLKAGAVDAKKIQDAIIKLAAAKGMPVLEAQAKTFDAKLGQVKNTIKGVFADIATGPITNALESVRRMFDANTASGQAMRSSLAKAFEGLGAAITTGLPAFIAAVETVVKIVGKAIDVLADVKEVYDRTLGEGVAEDPGIAAMDKAWAAEKTAADKAQQDRADAWAASVKGATKAGADAGAGFVAGLIASTPAAASASSSLASAAINAMKSALDASSPSKKFMQLGKWSGEGYVLGMQQTKPIESALASVTMPDAANTNVANTSNRSVALTGPFYFYGVADAEDAEARFSALLTQALEGDVQQVGAGEVAT